MNTLVREATLANDSATTEHLVNQSSEAPLVADAAPESVLIVAVALATGLAIHLASRALEPIADVVKAIAAAGMATLLMVVVLVLALVLLIIQT